MRKSLTEVQDAAEKSGDFKRVLGTAQLALSGMGFVLGSGIFVLTGTVAAKYAGPAACLTFFVAAIPAVLAALCYAELVTLMPQGGGAYTFVNVGLGELPGFLTGWMLSLTYVGGCSLVGGGWAAYVTRAIENAWGPVLPHAWTSAPWHWDAVNHTLQATGSYMNLPACLIILAMAVVTLMGARESIGFTAFLVALKLAVIFLLIIMGAPKVDTRLWVPFIPDNTGEFGHFGLSGLVRGTGVAIFAYLGVDNICTAAQEAKEPQRTIPQAIMITLSICTVLYIAVCLVLVGLVPYARLAVDDPIAVGVAALQTPWLERAVQFGSVAGLTSVLLMQMYGLPRILFAMSKDGLAPVWAGKLNPKTRAPSGGILLMAGLASAGAALLPVDMLGGVASNGTMITFMAVSLAVPSLRRLNPDVKRPFTVPFGPVVIPAAAVVTCGALVVTAPSTIVASLIGWLVLGTCVYAARRSIRPAAGHVA